MLGDIVLVWHVDGILETIAQVRGSLYASFRWTQSKKLNVGPRVSCLVSPFFARQGGFCTQGGFRDKSDRDTPALPLPKARETRTGRPLTAEISIVAIEILNCTFDPKPLYQRYIQVVVRAI